MELDDEDMSGEEDEEDEMPEDEESGDDRPESGGGSVLQKESRRGSKKTKRSEETLDRPVRGTDPALGNAPWRRNIKRRSGAWSEWSGVAWSRPSFETEKDDDRKEDHRDRLRSAETGWECVRCGATNHPGRSACYRCSLAEENEDMS